MANKYEFKPDKPHSGFLSKLHLTQKQRRTLLKWLLYSLVLLVLALLQDVILSRVRVFGATTDLVPCGIFLICILEGTESGSIFALAASLFYLFSGTAPGAYAMVFITALTVFLCIFRQAYLQQGFGSTLLCTGAAVLIYELAVFAIGLFLELTVPARFTGFLITSGLSFLAAPILYPLFLSIKSIGGKAWKE